MKTVLRLLWIVLLFGEGSALAQKSSRNSSDRSASDWKLVWSDEFSKPGRLDPRQWIYETGFVRNEEAQWYQPENARCEKGLLVIEARRERKSNPRYKPGSKDWKTNRKEAAYTSACVTTQGRHQWLYGRFEIRARIDTRPGLWPAFWTLGVNGEWPHNGEIDIMEYYRGMLLANAAWGGERRWASQWSTTKKEIDSFRDPGWSRRFHLWRMDWDEQAIRLYVDNQLLNYVDLTKTVNRDKEGKNPFHQPHYLLLNLAIGGTNGGDPSKTDFPARYEIDYVRVYQRANPGTASRDRHRTGGASMQKTGVRHRYVAGDSAHFTGWPANNGVWMWDGTEILVAFSYGNFVEQAGHNIEGLSDDTPTIRTRLARSKDGGKTWKMEEPQGFVTFRAPLSPPPGNIRFDDPNLALRVVGIGYHGNHYPEGGFYLSQDRGKSWQGPFHFGALMHDPHLKGMECTARTGYLATGPSSCLLFLSARPRTHGGGKDKAFCAETTDGGKTFRFVSWIVPLSDPYRAVMPTVVRHPDDTLIAVLRRRDPHASAAPCWVDCYASSDQGRHWTFRSRVGETGGSNGNPPALVALTDGRLCCVYGDRSREHLLARFSADAGESWTEEIVLRDDFLPDRYQDKDFGYPRLVQNRRGELVALYYWADRERPQQHIAATLWKP